MGLWDSPAGSAALQKFELSPGSLSKGNMFGKLSEFLDHSGMKLKQGVVCSPKQQKFGLLSDLVDLPSGKLKNGMICSPLQDTAHNAAFPDTAHNAAYPDTAHNAAFPDTTCKHFSPDHRLEYNVKAQVNYARARSGYQPGQTDGQTDMALTDRQKITMGQDDDPTNYISAEDVFDKSGMIKPGCEHIVKGAVFMLPDGTSCSMGDIIRDNKLNIGKFFQDEIVTTSPYPPSEALLLRSPSLAGAVPSAAFSFQGVDIVPDKFYYGPIAGSTGLVRFPGSLLFQLQDDPHQILAVYQGGYHHLGSLITEERKLEHDKELERRREAVQQKRRPLRDIPTYTTVLTSTTEISNPKVFNKLILPCDKATSPLPEPATLPEPPSPPKRTGVSHETALVYQISFNTIEDGALKGVPLCQKGYPLRVGPYGHFLYPLSDIGEALGPDGKPLPIADDGRVKWPTDPAGHPICPKKYRVPRGPDGYPIALDKQAYEPCGRLAVQSSEGPRLAVGPAGVVLFPVNSEGRSCDLTGDPFPALSDGRPCWPCNGQGQPIAADGRVVNVGTDGYPIDLKGRYLSPGGTIVIKTKMPYPNLREVPPPTYLQSIEFSDKMVHFPFSFIFGADFQINEVYKSIFTVPGATLLLPEQFMEHAPNHVYKSLHPSSPYKPADTQTQHTTEQSSPQKFYEAAAFYENSPRCPGGHDRASVRCPHPFHKHLVSPQGSLHPASPCQHPTSPTSPCHHTSPQQPSSPHHHTSPQQPSSPHHHTSPQQPSSPHHHTSPQQPSSPHHHTSPQQPSSPHHHTSPCHHTSPLQTPRRHNHLYKNYEVPGQGTPNFNTPGSPGGKHTNVQSGKQTNKQTDTQTPSEAAKQKRKVTPFYAVYLNNEWVQIAKKHARMSKSKPEHLVVKYNNSTYLVPRAQVRPLQVSGAGPREIVSVPAARGGLSRTFSVERISQPTSADSMFVLQLVAGNMPSQNQISQVKKEILGIHPTASILTEAQFRTVGLETIDESDSKPIMVRVEGGRAPHYFRYVEELVTAEEAEKQTVSSGSN